MNLRCNTSLPRKDIANIVIKYANKAFNADIFFASPVTFLVENLNINYTTKHYEGTIVNKYIGDDLYETPPNTAEIIINTPMNSDEQRNPLAKRFAAKEALGKALGTGVREPILLPAIAVIHDALGKPAFEYSPVLAAYLAAKGLTAHLSLSDESDSALAFVILETI